MIVKNVLLILSGIIGLVGLGIFGYIFGYTLNDEVTISINEHPWYVFGFSAMGFSAMTQLFIGIFMPEAAKKS